MEIRDNPSPQSLPHLPWKIRTLLILISKATNFTQRRDGTVNRRLFNLLDVKVPPNPKPINGVKTTDVTVKSSHNLWFRLFIPTFVKPLPVIVYFHGGGFAYFSASTKTYDSYCRRLAGEVNAVVVSVNYRLAPEYCYPAAYDDGFDVIKFLDEKGAEFLPENADVACCFLAGDSAGGNLAHHVAIRACQTKFQHVKVIGLVGLQPFFGGEERTEAEKIVELNANYLLTVAKTYWFWKMFMPNASRDHEVINVSGSKAINISGLDFPATMVVVGGADILQDWQRKYYRWLKSSGKEARLVEYPNMIHGFYGFTEFQESTKLVSEVRDFVNFLMQNNNNKSSELAL